MMKRRNWATLLGLGLFLGALLIVSALAAIPKPQSAGAVPTLMVLPPAQAAAALPTSSVPAPPAAPPVTEAPRAAADEPATTQPAEASSEPAEPVTAAPTWTPLVLPPALPAAAILAQPGVPLNPPAQPVTVPGQVVIRFAPNASQAERAAYLAQIGGTVMSEIAALDTVVVSVPAEVALAPLAGSPAVAQAEPDYLASALAAAPNDPLYPEQWALAAIGAPEAWAVRSSSAAPVTVAVIDSGICAGHPDLAGRIVAGYDFLDNDDLPQDTFGHGCAVSAIVAANANDGMGMAGVAPNARIMPLRVLDEHGIGPYSAVAAALVYAADHGAQVINLSLGGAAASSVLEDAVQYALNKGVAVVAAAGNGGATAPILYPAAYSPVIAVGAFDASGAPASFSSGGTSADVLAPGVNILSAALDGGYTRLNGTSFAAPYVAAAIALGYTPAGPGALLWLGAGEQPDAAVPTALPTGTAVDLAPYQALLDRASAEGTVRVIAALAVPFSPEAGLDAQAVQAQREQVAAAQASVMSAMSGQNAVVVAESQLWTIPYLALELDGAALVHLLNLPEVSGVEEDALLAPSLQSSVPVVEADDAWAAGYDGTGQTVAVLDTGAQADHPFLNGKVVSEACFSSQSGFTYTLCPFGGTAETGPGSASPAICVARGIGSGCSHGTHVSGIAAGSNGSVGGQPINGIARGANLIEIIVFSEVRNATTCGGPSTCALAYTSNIISGLQRTYDLRGAYSIASANISIGGGQFSGFCDTQSIKASIDQLKGVGIATVIASGNDSFTNSVSFPACVSSAVSVGATNDADVVASFSNSGPQLDLLAPGVAITSSVIGGGYESWGGTSMAAPHVAGAWAILNQCNPNATVDQVLAALVNTGQLVTDSRNGRVTPRIRIKAALDWLDANVGCTVPPTPTHTPTNTPVASNTPVATATNTPSPQPNRIINGTFSNGLAN
ncbi:MAG: S8 family serine peptidase, partial [Anaerolineae bacterium]|nr:S8 family serine peptidase [Anaerolineae bacterium]